MATIAAWALFALGVIHIVFGLIRFKEPVAEAVAAGFVGQFTTPEIRHTAFWFLIAGPLVMFAGHTAIHALAIGDLALFRMVGIYSLVTSIVGVAAFPKSPLVALLVIALLIVATGYGVVP
jgi:hypothetical protein